MRDKDFGIATPDYAIEFSPQDVGGWVDVAYLSHSCTRPRSPDTP